MTSLFMEKMNWYRGNTHLHTTASDGWLSEEEARAIYQAHGYDFWAITDHWIYAPSDDAACPVRLSGIEYNVWGPARRQVIHIVGIGMWERPSLEPGEDITAQDLIDAIIRAGGMAILAHPAWSLQTVEAILPLKGLSAAEIYNTAAGPPWNHRADSSSFLDVLSAQGMLLGSVAADDTHYYQGDQCKSHICVNASVCTRDGLMEALRAGRYYASQGPEIYQIRTDNHGLELDCSPVARAVLKTNMFSCPDSVHTGENLTTISFDCPEGVHYARVELTDSQGRQAWTHPVILTDSR